MTEGTRPHASCSAWHHSAAVILLQTSPEREKWRLPVLQAPKRPRPPACPLSSLTWCCLLGDVSSHGAHRRPPAPQSHPPAPSSLPFMGNGHSPQGAPAAKGQFLREVPAVPGSGSLAGRGVTVLKQILLFPPLLRTKHSLHRGHHLTESTLHLRRAPASSQQPLRYRNTTVL